MQPSFFLAAACGDEPASDQDGHRRRARRAGLCSTRAGWHLSDRTDVSLDITLMPLTAKYSELNPVEDVWQFIGDYWLSNRVRGRA
jgi:hypothetical protein